MISANGRKIITTIFPDGTSQIWKLSEELLSAEKLYVRWDFEQERELMDLVSLRALFRGDMHLYMPYLPYARQDKPVNNDSTFNLHAFSNIINSLNFSGVMALDVHNPDKTHRLIDRFKNLEVDHIHRQLISKLEPDFLVFPDLGARDRYLKPKTWLKRLIFYKVRDQKTGEIVGHDISYRDSFLGVSVHTSDAASVIGNRDRFLIIDDICDGGATFLSIAKKLQETGKAPDIHLFVTHGIFSQGREKLESAGITLYTTRSLLKNKGERCYEV